jgi:hypothetical protein
MPMLKLTPGHQRLQRLAGDWEGEERLTRPHGRPVETAIGKMRARVEVDGLFLIENYVREKDGRVVFRGHGVMGWDTETEAYTSYWVDSMGFPFTAPARGHWEGDTLSLRTTVAGSDVRYVYRLEGDRAYHFRAEKSVDGGHTWKPSLEATYRRK